MCVCIIGLEEMDYEWVQSGTKKYREGFVLSKIVAIWDKQVILKNTCFKNNILRNSILIGLNMELLILLAKGIYER